MEYYGVCKIGYLLPPTLCAGNRLAQGLVRPSQPPATTPGGL